MSAHGIFANLRMTTIRKPRATLMLLVAIALCTAPARAQTADPAQGDGRVSAFYSWQDAIPQPGRVLRQEPLDPAFGLSDAGVQVRILYSSTNGIDGKSPIAVSGLLFLPKGTPPTGGWRCGTSRRRFPCAPRPNAELLLAGCSRASAVCLLFS